MICCSHVSEKKLTENNLEMLYDTSTIEKSQDIRLQLSFWDKLARFSSMISWEESPFSSLAPTRALLYVYCAVVIGLKPHTEPRQLSAFCDDL